MRLANDDLWPTEYNGLNQVQVVSGWGLKWHSWVLGLSNYFAIKNVLIFLRLSGNFFEVIRKFFWGYQEFFEVFRKFFLRLSGFFWEIFRKFFFEVIRIFFEVSRKFFWGYQEIFFVFLSATYIHYIMEPSNHEHYITTPAFFKTSSFYFTFQKPKQQGFNFIVQWVLLSLHISAAVRCIWTLEPATRYACTYICSSKVSANSTYWFGPYDSYRTCVFVHLREIQDTCVFCFSKSTRAFSLLKELQDVCVQ